METVTVYKVRPEEGTPWLVLDSLNELTDYLDGDEPQEFTIQRVKMTKAERDSLGEFKGW